MFRIAFIVEDKNLPHVLKAITGLVLADGMQTQFVANAEVKGGKVVAKTSGGTVLELFADWLNKEAPKIINIDLVRSFLTKQGYTPKSAGGLLNAAKEAGLVKKRGKPGEGWIVVANNNFYKPRVKAKSKARGKLKSKRGRPPKKKLNGAHRHAVQGGAS